MKKDDVDTVDQQTKAALKQDHFVTTTSHGLEWASENRRSVIVTVSLLLGAIVLVVLSAVLYSKRASAASVAFGEAMQAYQTPLAAAGGPGAPRAPPARGARRRGSTSGATSTWC